MKTRPHIAPPDMSRRRFVTGLAAGSAVVGLCPGALLAAAPNTPQPELRGSRFHLTVGEQRVNFTGRERVAATINGSLPAPILRWREGDVVTLDVTNRLGVDTSIHWHGIILPENMDGVPGISFPGIRPGETFRYRFAVNQSGTYWYHSHSGFQEQIGMYGAIVVEPRRPDPHPTERDYTVVLSDWTDDDPSRIYATLKKKSHYYKVNERTLGDFLDEVNAKGLGRAMADRKMWNHMRMSDRDISDVTGMTYTFLMNGRTPAQGWTGLFRPGERIRLRLINASAMTFFDVRIPGLKMTVVGADGQNLQPVVVDELRMGVAETYDVVVEPDDGPYCLFAQAIDRSGYARGTLTPDPSLRAEVPPMDPPPVLSHADMGHAMDHGDDHAGHGHGADVHHMHGKGHDHGQDHDGHGSSNANGHDAHGVRPGMADGMNTGMVLTSGLGPAGFGSVAPVVHAPTEYGPHVDMRAEAPRPRLDDPGVGLRDNGRRVLTYADLRNLDPTPDMREPEREIQMHLTGNMARYMWSIDGVRHADAPPLHFRYGERLRIVFVNDTMMNHPMHLHGMWSDLETGDPHHIPRKHTVVVQPGATLSMLVTADAMGAWAFHCHLMYHMLGMFRTVVVSEEGA